jgi:hypothetical protein
MKSIDGGSLQRGLLGGQLAPLATALRRREKHKTFGSMG